MHEKSYIILQDAVDMMFVELCLSSQPMGTVVRCHSQPMGTCVTYVTASQWELL